MKQEEIFLNGEGDKYFERNITKICAIDEVDVLYDVYLKYIKSDMRVLEIGCCNGHNLNFYRMQTGCTAYGIDPSEKAIKSGLDTFANVNLFVGTAEELPFTDEYFDFIIFGFCLYLVDRKILSKVVCEADRVLKDGGIMGITDFDSKIPKKRSYKHYNHLYSYKYDYSKIFLSFPHYSLIEKYNKGSVNNDFKTDYTQRVSSAVMYKNHESGYFNEVDL